MSRGVRFLSKDLLTSHEVVELRALHTNEEMVL